MMNKEILALWNKMAPGAMSEHLEWLNIFKSCGSSDNFNYWRFGGWDFHQNQAPKLQIHIANEKTQLS